MVSFETSLAISLKTILPRRVFVERLGGFELTALAALLL
jgi:hypothetical protein